MTDQMTSGDAGIYLADLFAKAAKPDKKYRNQDEQTRYSRENGAQRFKRRVLGLCGHVAVKSLDQVAQLLVDTGIISSLDEARETVPKIVRANKLNHMAISRGDGLLGDKYLRFEEVKDQKGNVMYRISSFSYDSGI